MQEKTTSAHRSYNKKIPKPIRSVLKKIVGRFVHPRIGSKPTPKVFENCEITPFKFDCSGAFCLSADFEQSWAWMYDTPDMLKMGSLERKYFPRLFRELEKHNIPITWAIVGHLFLDECKRDKSSGLAHPDMPRPENHYSNDHWSWEKGDWYQFDPCTDIKKDPDWYAKDLIKMIIDSNVEHEVGTHSFSHIDFSNKNCDKKLADSEIKKCIEVMADMGSTPRSMVFPGGFEGNFDVLSKNNLISYRGGGPIELSYPYKINEGLWNINQSVFLFAHEGEDYLKRSIRYIKKAVKNNQVCHISFHPSNLNDENMKHTFLPILKYAEERKKMGELWIATMKDLAIYCEAREHFEASVKQTKRFIIIDSQCKIDARKYESSEITLKISIPRTRRVKSIDVDGKEYLIGKPYCYIKHEETAYLILTVPTGKNKILIEYK